MKQLLNTVKWKVAVKRTQEVADVIGWGCLAGAEEKGHAVQEQANLLIQ